MMTINDISRISLLKEASSEFHQSVISNPATILSTDGLFDLINTKHINTAFIKVYDPDGNKINQAVYSSELCETLVNPLKLFHLYHQKKCSVVVNSLDIYCEKIETLRLLLENKFNCIIEVNSYLTPANGQTLGWHSDGHQVLVLHIEGEKIWYVSEDTDKYDQCKRLTMSPGDILQIARGFMHTAKASNSPSFHLTFSIYESTSDQGIEIGKALSQNQTYLKYRHFLENGTFIKDVELVKNCAKLNYQKNENELWIQSRQHVFTTSSNHQAIIDYLNDHEVTSSFKLMQIFNTPKNELEFLLIDLMEKNLIYALNTNNF